MSSEETDTGGSEKERIASPNQLAPGSKRTRVASPYRQNKPSVREAEIVQRQREQEERLAPDVAKLAVDSDERFIESLDRVIKDLGKRECKRSDVVYVLRQAWIQAPDGVSGAVIAKHYRVGAAWSYVDIIEALDGLRGRVAIRENEVHRLGRLVHGALIVLVFAEPSAKPAQRSKSGPTDVVVALVDLHRAIWREDRAPLSGLDEPHPDKVLTKAAWLLDQSRDHTDVQSIVGQRLFGFEYVFGLSDAGQHPTTPVESLSEGAPVASAKPGATVPPSFSSGPKDRGKGRSRDESESAKRLLEVSEAARERLRADLAEAREEVRRLRAQLSDVTMRQENLTAHATQLQAEVDAAKSLSDELCAERRRAEAAESKTQELIKELDRSESQNQTAKNSEYERGRAAMRAAIARHCMEPLAQIAESARSVEGDGAEFIRAMTESLAKYLDGR